MNLLYILVFTLSANVFAQSSTSPFKDAKPKTYFEKKGQVGNWTSEKPTFNYNVYQGGYSPVEVLDSISLIPDAAGDCVRPKSTIFAPRQVLNLDTIMSPSKELECREAYKIKETKLLNPALCLMLANCYKSKIKPGEENYQTLIKAREKTAAEAVSLMSLTTITNLYDQEELKAYALAKYTTAFIPKNCSEVDPLLVPQADEQNCKTSIIDSGYEMAQKACRIIDLDCKSDYLQFVKNKKTENGKTSLLSEYIQTKTASSALEFLKDDSQITKDIASLMADKLSSPEERAKKIIKYLNKNYLKLDPIYKSYIKQSLQNKLNNETDEVEEGLIKYITENSNKNLNELQDGLEQLRKKLAYKRLSENCTKVITVKKLCTIVNEVLNGAEIQVPQASLERLLKRQEYSNLESNMTRQEMADNISRCNTFSVDTSIMRDSSLVVRLSNGLDLFSTDRQKDFYLAKLDLASGIEGSSGLGPIDSRAQIIFKKNGDVTKTAYKNSKDIENLGAGKKDEGKDTGYVDLFSRELVEYQVKNSSKPVMKIEKPEVHDNYNNVAKEEPLKIIPKEQEVTRSQTQSQPQSRDPQINIEGKVPFQALRQAEIFPESHTDVASKAEASEKQSAVEYKNLLGKISGLEEKLASAQKKTSAIDSAGPQVVPEETETARELRLARASLAELKAAADMKSKKSEVLDNNIGSTPKSKSRVKKAQKSIGDSDNEDGSDDLVIASSSPAKEVRAASAKSAVSGASQAPKTSSDSPSSRSERSSASIEDSRASSRASSASEEGLVLTRLDGVSGLKVNETISRMILAEAGRPFYIEEGGFVKQIIPEVVDGVVLKAEDGTPLYKTIFKGKVGEFQIDDKDKDKPKKELMKKATSPADVKMQDYQNTSAAPVVRYREMQEVFNSKKK